MASRSNPDRPRLRAVCPIRTRFTVLAALAVALPAAVHGTPLTITVSDAQGQPLAGAAVSVTVHGTPARAPNATAALAQRSRRFDPGLLVVQTGTAVSFPNEDTVRHHVYSFSPINPFEIKLYVGTPARPVVFDKPGTAVLGCNIHDQMVGYIHVVDTPHFGVSDAKGQVRLEVPPGEHRVQAWHPDLTVDAVPIVSSVKVDGTSASHAMALMRP